MARGIPQSVNWNGHLLCSIDIETSGLDPTTCEILELAIVPLRPNLTVNADIKPFDMLIRPKDPDAFPKNCTPIANLSFADLLLQSTEAWTVVDLLEEWFRKLNLPERKKIIPLGHNFNNFDMPFLKNWMGPLTYNHIFDYHIRDTMQCGLYLNDMADWMGNNVPFAKVDLGYMCTTLGIKNMRRHRALGDALATAELYRQMVTRLGPNLLNLSKLMSGATQEESLLKIQSDLDALKTEKVGHKDSACNQQP